MREAAEHLSRGGADCRGGALSCRRRLGGLAKGAKLRVMGKYKRFLCTAEEKCSCDARVCDRVCQGEGRGGQRRGSRHCGGLYL